MLEFWKSLERSWKASSEFWNWKGTGKESCPNGVLGKGQESCPFLSGWKGKECCPKYLDR